MQNILLIVVALLWAVLHKLKQYNNFHISVIAADLSHQIYFLSDHSHTLRVPVPICQPSPPPLQWMSFYSCRNDLKKAYGFFLLLVQYIVVSTSADFRGFFLTHSGCKISAQLLLFRGFLILICDVKYFQSCGLKTNYFRSFFRSSPGDAKENYGSLCSVSAIRWCMIPVCTVYAF